MKLYQKMIIFKMMILMGYGQLGRRVKYSVSNTAEIYCYIFIGQLKKTLSYALGNVLTKYIKTDESGVQSDDRNTIKG